MQHKFPKNKFKNLRFFIGDIRDLDRLKIAMRTVDVVVHAAALKQISAAEYNPFEAIKTNIIGTQNIVESCVSNNVKKAILLSTDKACSPINLYGSTKLAAEKIFSTAKNYLGKKTKFSIVRYGNVNGSRGSVMPLFKKFSESKNRTLLITDKSMTRFSITMDAAINMIIWSLKNLEEGETLIPKIPSYRISDLANCFGNIKKKYIGIREGEKIHEELISAHETNYALDIGKYIILPSSNNPKIIKNYVKKFKAKQMKLSKSYNSLENNQFLKISDLKNIISKLEIN